MMQNIDFQQLKTFSMLSETPQFVDNGARNRYVSYLGYVFTYSTFCTLLLWTVSGPTMYRTIWEETPDIELIKKLNSHDTKLNSMNKDYLAEYFVAKFRENLEGRSPEYVENLVSQMFELTHTINTV